MIFSLKDVWWQHPGKPKESPHALAGIDLEIPAGSRVGLMGPSGSGKTTLMQVLGLLWEEPCTKGEIRCHIQPDGTGEIKYSELRGGKHRSRFRKSHFGFVLQNSHYIRHLGRDDNIILPLLMSGKDKRSALDEAAGLIRMVNLAPGGGSAIRPRQRLLGRETAESQSLGQRQRMAVLRAIVGDPDVVFADEPTSNLDPMHTRKVINLLRMWHRGDLARPESRAKKRTLVMVSHNPVDLFREDRLGADFLVCLEDGRIRALEGSAGRGANPWGFDKFAFKRPTDMDEAGFLKLLGPDFQ